MLAARDVRFGFYEIQEGRAGAGVPQGAQCIGHVRPGSNVSERSDERAYGSAAVPPYRGIEKLAGVRQIHRELKGLAVGPTRARRGRHFGPPSRQLVAGSCPPSLGDGQSCRMPPSRLAVVKKALGDR